jgi:hypothetical protein
MNSPLYRPVVSAMYGEQINEHAARRIPFPHRKGANFIAWTLTVGIAFFPAMLILALIAGAVS